MGNEKTYSGVEHNRVLEGLCITIPESAGSFQLEANAAGSELLVELHHLEVDGVHEPSEWLYSLWYQLQNQIVFGSTGSVHQYQLGDHTERASRSVWDRKGADPHSFEDKSCDRQFASEDTRSLRLRDWNEAAWLLLGKQWEWLLWPYCAYHLEWLTGFYHRNTRVCHWVRDPDQNGYKAYKVLVLLPHKLLWPVLQGSIPFQSINGRNAGQELWWETTYL